MKKWAYYNDSDPYVCEWVRNLIGKNLVAPGEVDCRPIQEVTGDDVKEFAQAHWFCGIGGWSYALRLAGWADSEPVWTGSCPCQPLSSAGQHKGHADERHLWPAFHALIAERRPATIFGEQVASKDGREWLAGVRADLEALGYALGAADLCAASAGAPHIRQRLYWLADAKPRRLPSGIFRCANEGANIFASHDCQAVQAEGGRARYGESPLPLVDHGVPADVAASEAIGNAIVPQVAAAFIECTMTATARPPQRGGSR